MNPEITVGRRKQASGWSMIWGVLMFACGLLAIFLPRASSVGFVIILSWLILFAGIWQLIFAFHSHSIGGFTWKLLVAAIYLATGIYMLANPLLSVVSLTLVLAILFLFEGVVEIVLYFVLHGVRHAGWFMVDGIITLILGILIWRQWPSSSVWVIGTLVGISLIISGIARFMHSFAARPV